MSKVLYNCERVMILFDGQVQIYNPQTLSLVLTSILKTKLGLLFLSEGTWRQSSFDYCCCFFHLSFDSTLVGYFLTKEVVSGTDQKDKLSRCKNSPFPLLNSRNVE